MKSSIAVLAVTFLLSLHSLAQPGDKREQIEAQKVAFLTRQLELTPEKSQEFWPVYNEYREKLDKNRPRVIGEVIDKGGLDEMSDEEIESMIDRIVNSELERAKLQQEYIKRFREILTVRQVAELMKAELQFKRTLLRRLRDGDRQRMERR